MVGFAFQSIWNFRGDLNNFALKARTRAGDERGALYAAASLAFAAADCNASAPAKPALPSVAQPEQQVAGRPRFYATATLFEGFAQPVIVETHEGRPTKIEGNPDHPVTTQRREPVTPRQPRANTKEQQVIALRRPQGATLAQIGAHTGWRAYTICGFFAGVLKKRRGMQVTSEKMETGERLYRLADGGCWEAEDEASPGGKPSRSRAG